MDDKSLRLVVAITFAAGLLLASNAFAADWNPETYRQAVKSKAGAAIAKQSGAAAITAAQAQAAAAPSEAVWSRLLAATLRKAGKNTEAIQPLKIWLSSTPQDGVASVYLAEALAENGDRAGALQVLKDLQSKRPGTIEADAAALLVSRLEAGGSGKIDTQNAMSGKSFVDTSASERFKAKDYMAAADAFRSLSAEHPQDAAVWRYLGVSLQESGRPEEALIAFERAFQLDPLGVSLHQEWGAALKGLGRADEAKRHFSFVKQYDVTGAYAKKADKKEKASGDKKEKKEKAPKKPWKISGNWGYVYDTNVKKRSNRPVARKAADIDAGKWHYKVAGALELLKKDPWTIKADVSADTSYFDSSFNQKNKRAYQAGIAVGYKTEMFGKKTNIVVRNAGLLNRKEHKYNSTGYKNSVNFEWDWTPNYTPSLGNKISYNGVEDDGNLPTYTDKDGWVEEVELMHKYTPDPKQKDGYVELGNFYRHDFAVGLNNITNQWGAKAGVSVPLAPTWVAGSGIKWADVQYPKFAHPGRTIQKRGSNWTIDGSIVHEINLNWELEFDYVYSNADNKNDKFQSDSHAFGVQANYKY